MATIQFDVSKEDDIHFVLNTINNVCRNSFTNPEEGIDSSTENENEYNNKLVQNKCLQIKDYIYKQFDEISKSLDEKESQLIICQKENVTYKTRLAEKEGEIENLRDCNENLKKQISELQQRLNEYEPSIGAKPGEFKYFKIDGQCLTETNSTDAPYQVKIGDNGLCMFHFNIDKGPVSDACNKRDEMLLPFCEIIDECQNANELKKGAWGEAIITQSGELQIKRKARINLIRI